MRLICVSFSEMLDEYCIDCDEIWCFHVLRMDQNNFGGSVPTS